MTDLLSVQRQLRHGTGPAVRAGPGGAGPRVRSFSPRARVGTAEPRAAARVAQTSPPIFVPRGRQSHTRLTHIRTTRAVEFYLVSEQQLWI